MLIQNLSPVLFRLFGFEVRFYGLVYALGFLTVYYYLKKNSEKLGFKSRVDVDAFVVYLFVGLILGARIGHVFYNLNYYLRNPLLIPALWHGGMSFYGGLVGVVITALLFCKHYNVSFWLLADRLAPITALFLAFGRIANFLNSELVGIPTNKPWCVVFPKVDNICRHPVQLYESIKNLFIFGGLTITAKLRKLEKGVIFALFLALYGLLRFLTNFYRDEPLHYGLNTGQWLGILVFIIGITLILKLKKQGKKRKSRHENVKNKNEPKKSEKTRSNN